MMSSAICAFDACFSRSRSTGKERDPETGEQNGNDYFGARYYASSMGRFMSPDWSAIPAAVPYAKLENPQTLNLYAYVGNNPLGRVDKDGHDDYTYDQSGKQTGYVKRGFWHNFFQGNSYTLNADNGKSYSMEAALKPLSGGQRYTLVGAQKQNQSSTATTNPNAAAEQHHYDLVVNRVNKLLGTNDAADHIDSDGKLVGGNFEFSINHNDKSDAAFQRSLNKALGEADGDPGAHGGLTPPTHRLGFSTSLHHDNDALHVDHFNGAKFPVGTLLHAIVDVGYGHLMGPNFAFSYAGVQQ
jgi:RHS repeat-associated protein